MKMINPWQVFIASKPTSYKIDPDSKTEVLRTHKNAEIAFDQLGKCLEDVKLWLCANKLKLNADKTDFIIFGSKSQQKS